MAHNAISNYRKLRAGLIARGLTIRQFAIRHGFRPITVYAAARGERHGKLSQTIITKLQEAINEK